MDKLKKKDLKELDKEKSQEEEINELVRRLQDFKNPDEQYLALIEISSFLSIFLEEEKLIEFFLINNKYRINKY